MSLERLIQQAQAGDREAVASLYQTHVDRIYRYVYYRVSTEQDAQDLTAEVFVKMVEGLANYRVTGVPFEAWLYRIAAARVIDFRRRANRRPQSELSENLFEDDTSPENRLLNQQEVEILRRAVSSLNEEQQTILVLRFIERKSHQEVAAIVHKSVSAVKSIQHRALTQLAQLLGETKVRHYLRGGQSDE